MMIEPENQFKLRTYLLADAKRYYAVFKPRSTNPSIFKLCLIMLSPRFMPVLLCRLAYSATCLRLSPLAKIISLINYVLFGLEVSIRCPIGAGLIFPHTQGIVIGARAIGDNATIFQGVTIGAKELDVGYELDKRPNIGHNVILGAGAKILGKVTIGDGVHVGANSVVLKDVPDYCVVAGIPSKIIKTLITSS